MTSELRPEPAPDEPSDEHRVTDEHDAPSEPAPALDTEPVAEPATEPDAEPAAVTEPSEPAGSAWVLGAVPPGGSYPGADLPPFGGFRPPPPPPGTSGYATRYGLVRPAHDRYIAGVCGALARATNTDPVLWRVGLPALSLLGGLGAIVYLLGWLLIPAEGDSASPLESLAGRGWSSTSRVTTIVLVAITATSVIGGLANGFGAGRFVLIAVVVGVVALLSVSQRDRPGGPSQPGRPPWAPPPPPGVPQPPMPGMPPPPYAGAPRGPYVPWVGTKWPQDTPAGGTAPMAPTGVGWPAGRSATDTDADIPAAAADPLATTDLGPTPVTGYRPPFAPYGPYVPSSAPETYAFPGLATTTAPPPPVPPVRGSRRSPVRRITLSATLVVIGLLALLDAANALSIPAAGYLAAALATVAVGIIAGALFGRSRGPLTIGSLLAVALLISVPVSGVHAHLRNVDAHPTSVAAIAPSYEVNAGKIVLDLRDVSDFAGHTTSVDLRVNAGQITVEVPPDVDVKVVAIVNVGNTKLFGAEHGGINVGTARVNDVGSDGPGGGTLIINATANVGQIEVTR